ncbi:MAG: DUF4091 domain-containing protein [Acidobacteria bacterium]|nr:DUF4091 domain-containing protein [Acidobacteriota bacterium]
MRQILPFTGGVLGVFVLLSLFAGKASTQDLTLWTTNALDKVRPSDPPPTGAPQAAQLYAARNEFEPFQLVLRSDVRDIVNVDVQISNLARLDGATIANDNFTIYFERYLNLSKSSTRPGAGGEWPDPLIPKVDRYAGEARNAFPFTLQRGRNQAIWVELYVPANAQPGTYSGELKITGDQLTPVSVPVSLSVWNFSLPSTSSLKTTFGLNGLGVLKQHRAQYSDEELHALTYIYTKAALWHRISTHSGTLTPPPFTGDASNLKINWAAYDQEVGPFLDGTVFSPDQPLYGAKANTVDLRIHGSANTPELTVAYWKQWVNHFAAKGWLDRLFYYVWDEPTPDKNPQIISLATLAHTADPRIRNLVTTTLDLDLRGVIDIWSPPVNCVDSKPGFPPMCDRTVPRQAYETEIQRGKSLWWYQSCISHGCNGPGGDYFRGWPNYLIDAPGVANRVFPWITWRFNIEGELYFNMDENYSMTNDPWTEVYLFGGNGDGVFFYPGRPDRIGGTTDIPIESLRLKLIREGLEDYEYLNFLSGIGLRGCVDEVISRVVNKAYQWSLDPYEFYAARRELGDRANAQLGGDSDAASTSTEVRFSPPREQGALCPASQ